jgi:hypothetical protein
MTAQHDTATRNHLADQFEVHIGTGPTIRIFDGTMPANCATADAGTILATLALPSDWLAAASAGAKAMSGTWQDASADAAGVARYMRLYNSGGTCKQQMLVSDPWAPSRAYTVGHQVHNGGNLYRCTVAGTSASSGGPSGTGGSITDGGVTWTFVQAGTDMTVNNAALNAGQPFEITSYSFTVGGG